MRMRKKRQRVIGRLLADGVSWRRGGWGPCSNMRASGDWVSGGDAWREHSSQANTKGGIAPFPAPCPANHRTVETTPTGSKPATARGPHPPRHHEPPTVLVRETLEELRKDLRLLDPRPATASDAPHAARLNPLRWYRLVRGSSAKPLRGLGDSLRRLAVAGAWGPRAVAGLAWVHVVATAPWFAGYGAGNGAIPPLVCASDESSRQCVRAGSQAEARMFEHGPHAPAAARRRSRATDPPTFCCWPSAPSPSPHAHRPPPNARIASPDVGWYRRCAIRAVLGVARVTRPPVGRSGRPGSPGSIRERDAIFVLPSKLGGRLSCRTACGAGHRRLRRTRAEGRGRTRRFHGACDFRRRAARVG